MARRAWLMKSEPDVFGIADLRRKGREHWDGVRNYQARNFMREMKVGDDVLFYHSNATPPGVAGLARVSREAFPDHTAWDPKSKYHDPASTPDAPRWFMVEVEFVEEFASFLPLDRLKEIPALSDMLLFKRSRLSVQPVGPAELKLLCKLGRTRPPPA
jgi:predicted RNA-binding protein with PUA-like domain